jgi:cell filamentation protein
VATKFRTWEDYYVPGTKVLRNKLGLKTPEGVADAEERLAGVRLVELAANPVAGNFDYDHMKAIHRRIFQDVYEWAGQERVGPEGFMSKAGPDVVNFAPGDPAAPEVAYSYYPAPAIAVAMSRYLGPTRAI